MPSLCRCSCRNSECDQLYKYFDDYLLKRLLSEHPEYKDHPWLKGQFRRACLGGTSEDRLALKRRVAEKFGRVRVYYLFVRWHWLECILRQLRTRVIPMTLDLALQADRDLFPRCRDDNDDDAARAAAAPQFADPDNAITNARGEPLPYFLQVPASTLEHVKFWIRDIENLLGISPGDIQDRPACLDSPATSIIASTSATSTAASVAAVEQPALAEPQISSSVDRPLKKCKLSARETSSGGSSSLLSADPVGSATTAAASTSTAPSKCSTTTTTTSAATTATVPKRYPSVTRSVLYENKDDASTTSSFDWATTPIRYPVVHKAVYKMENGLGIGMKGMGGCYILYSLASKCLCEYRH